MPIKLNKAKNAELKPTNTATGQPGQHQQRKWAPHREEEEKQGIVVTADGLGK
jgi:hypothetical protein